MNYEIIRAFSKSKYISVGRCFMPSTNIQDFVILILKLKSIDFFFEKLILIILLKHNKMRSSSFFPSPKPKTYLEAFTALPLKNY